MLNIVAFNEYIENRENNQAPESEKINSVII